MLVAIDQYGRSYDLREVSIGGIKTDSLVTYRCPSCGKPVFLKTGHIRRPHFAHQREGRCLAFSEGETAEHLLGKKLLATCCDQHTTTYELEAYLPRLKQRPDLLIEGKLAIEFQCSSLSLERLVARTANYLKYGYRVIWLVGRHFFVSRKLTLLQKAMLNFSRRLGFYLWELDVIKKEIRCVYQIEERLISKEVFKSDKRWSLASVCLPTCFLFPEKAKIYQQRLYDMTTEVQVIKSRINKGLAYKNLAYLTLQEQCYLSKTYLQYFPYEYFGLLTDNLIAKDSSLLWWLQVIDYLNHCPSTKLEIVLEELTERLLAKQHYQIMPMIDRENIVNDFICQTINRLVQQGTIYIYEKTVREMEFPILLDSRAIPYENKGYKNNTMSLKSCIPYKNMLL